MDDLSCTLVSFCGVLPTHYTNTKFLCFLWEITLGEYDILAHVMSMSRFRLAPKIGHLERMRRLYRYLGKTKHFAIRYRTKEPDYSHLPEQEYQWTMTVYGNVKKEIPKDLPKPLGKRVITTTFLDANLLHDKATGNQHSCITLCQHHPNMLVFKMTNHFVDSNIWFRVCSCQNSNRANHGPQKYTKISRYPHHDQGIHVW